MGAVAGAQRSSTEAAKQGPQGGRWVAGSFGAWAICNFTDTAGSIVEIG